MFSDFIYDESVPSCLVWACQKGRAREGDMAGTKHNQGYYSVGVNCKRLLAHRVVWELHYGKIPDGHEVDHVDRDRANTKIGNLRLVTRHQNNGNQSKQSGKSSKYKGVHALRNGTFQAAIKNGGKKIHLGTFMTEELAAEAYKEAAMVYFDGVVGGLCVEI